MQQRPYRLVVSDVDGTLTNTQHEVVPRNVEAVRQWRQAGGLFTLATGRGPETADRYAAMVELALPAILYNGQLIYDFQAGRPLWEVFLGLEQAQLALDIAKRIGSVAPLVYRSGTIYSGAMNGPIRDALKAEHAIIHDVGNLRDWLREPPHKVILIGEAVAFAAFRAAYSEALQAMGLEAPHLVLSSPVFLEIITAGQNKGTALAWLARHLGVQLADVAAIGDHHNDIEMIRLAGLGAAPANAEPEVIAAARATVAHCDEGAVADLILNRLLPGRNRGSA